MPRELASVIITMHHTTNTDNWLLTKTVAPDWLILIQKFWRLLWSIDQLFHLDPYNLFFPGFKIFRCEGAHGVGFNLSLFSLHFFFSLWMRIDSRTALWYVAAHFIRKSVLSSPPWLMIVKRISPIDCNYLFLLIQKSHWHEWCVIDLTAESAID